MRVANHSGKFKFKNFIERRNYFFIVHNETPNLINGLIKAHIKN